MNDMLLQYQIRVSFEGVQYEGEGITNIDSHWEISWSIACLKNTPGINHGSQGIPLFLWSF